jgi:hypothetical protein
MVAVAFFRGYRRSRAARRDDDRDLAADQIGGHHERPGLTPVRRDALAR